MVVVPFHEYLFCYVCTIQIQSYMPTLTHFSQHHEETNTRPSPPSLRLPANPSLGYSCLVSRPWLASLLVSRKQLLLYAGAVYDKNTFINVGKGRAEIKCSGPWDNHCPQHFLTTLPDLQDQTPQNTVRLPKRRKESLNKS